MAELSHIIQLRVEELDKAIELTSSKIFSTVCQENNLNSSILEEVLGCDCPFGLIGFIQGLEEPELCCYLCNK